MRYDAGNHVTEVSSGPFKHRDAAGNEVTVSATESFSYDARGNKSTHTDARGYTERFHFDAQNRLASQWDGRLATPGAADSKLRTDHVYDSFDRLIGQRRTDTASLAVQTQGFEWSQFDQRTSFTDALARIFHATPRYRPIGVELGIPRA